MILSLIDQAAYIEAMRQVHHRYVTVCFKEVQLREPVYVGDVLSIYGDTTAIGRTSMTISLRVCARRRSDPDQVVHVTQGEVVFVAVNDQGKPTPIIAD